MVRDHAAFLVFTALFSPTQVRSIWFWFFDLCSFHLCSSVTINSRDLPIDLCEIISHASALSSIVFISFFLLSHCIFLISLFLDASTHLYKRVCPSGLPSVRKDFLDAPKYSKGLPNCPKKSQNVQLRRIVVRTDLLFFLLSYAFSLVSDSVYLFGRE